MIEYPTTHLEFTYNQTVHEKMKTRMSMETINTEINKWSHTGHILAENGMNCQSRECKYLCWHAAHESDAQRILPRVS